MKILSIILLKSRARYLTLSTTEILSKIILVMGEVLLFIDVEQHPWLYPPDAKNDHRLQF